MRSNIFYNYLTQHFISSLFIVFLSFSWTQSFATDNENPKKWIPGQPYPPELLDAFPCHDYELPCGSIPPPKVERVSFKGKLNGNIEKGEKIAIDLRWGNCIACHKLPGHEVGSGTIGPSLVKYGSRGLPLDYTYQRIWDPRVYSPNAHMPVFGPNKVLTEEEIIDVMTYLYSSK